MSFKFEFKIDYEKLTALLDTFLKSHSDELTSIMGKCLVLQPSSTTATTSTDKQENPPISNNNNTPVLAPAADLIIDKKPIIGDSIPQDPFENLFPNPNATTTRFQDRNNPNIKKGFRN